LPYQIVGEVIAKGLVDEWCFAFRRLGSHGFSCGDVAISTQ